MFFLFRIIALFKDKEVIEMVKKNNIGIHFKILCLFFSIMIFNACSGDSGSPSQDEILNPNEQVLNLCDNGVLDGNEIAIDCGGGCGDCPPACDNGVLDGDETSIDCGGSCNPCFTGRTFYISSNGNDDDNTGLSPDSPWKTIGHVNEQTFIPGDAILFKRDDTWREELRITWSGTPENYITFGAYGTGAKPKILGSKQATDWVAVEGHANIWRSGTSINRPEVGNYPYQHPGSIFFGELDGSTTWGRSQTDPDAQNPDPPVNSCGESFSHLQQEYDWCYDDNIYIYSPGNVNPGERYAFVEVPQRRNSITMESHNPKENIAIDGLSMMYGIVNGYNDGWPMNYEVSGLTIRNCHISHIGIRGGGSAMGLTIWHSDMLVQNNDIHDCGRRNISYNVYTDNSGHEDGLVFENVVFENNTLHNGYHTTGFDISHGSNAFGTFRNFTFRNNFIYDNLSDNPSDNINDFTSMSLYLNPEEGGLFENFKIHNNIIKNPKQKGLAIGSVHNLEIYNNVIYGMNPNIGSYRPMVSIAGDYKNVKFLNNIVYGTVSSELFLVRGVYFNGSQSEVTSMNNNIYFQEDSEQPIVYTPDTGNVIMSEWVDYQNSTQWDLNSPEPQDPLFVDPENNDFHLRPESRAINAGVDVGLPFEGDAPDIGAYETEE